MFLHIWVLFYIIIILISNIFAIKMILTIFRFLFYFLYILYSSTPSSLYWKNAQTNTIFPLLFLKTCVYIRQIFLLLLYFYGKEMFLLLIQTSVYGRNIYFKWIFSLILSTYVATLILYPWIDLLFVRICKCVYVCICIILHIILEVYVLNIFQHSVKRVGETF